MHLALFLLTFLGLSTPALLPPVNAAETLPPETVVTEDGTNGQIDWTHGVVRAMGSQPPLNHATSVEADQKQFSLAKSQAQQQLLKAIKRVRIHSDRVVADALKNYQVIADLQTLVINTHFIEREYLSDRTIRVTMSMPLHDTVSQLLLPQDIQPIKPIGATNGIAEAIASNGTYSGLIVDARTLDVRPMLVPEVIDDTGKPVYGTAFVSREFVVSRGMVSYVRKQDSIGLEERVGLNPLVIHGLKLADNNSGAIVVSSSEATKVREVSDHLELLRQCRVIIWVQ